MLHPVDTAHLSVLVAAHPRVQGAYRTLILVMLLSRGSSPRTGSLLPG